MEFLCVLLSATQRCFGLLTLGWNGIVTLLGGECSICFDAEG